MSRHHFAVCRLPVLVLLCVALLMPALPAAASQPAAGASESLAIQSDTTMWPPMIFAITCSVYADNFFSMEGIGLDLPEGCAFTSGASFTITDASGNFYGSCVTGDDGYCRGDVQVPVDVEVLVAQDEASIPAGYVVVGGNPQALTYPSGAMRGEGAPWLFVTMPAEIAGGRAGAPTGATEIATEVVPVTETATAAPASGGAASVRIEPGQDWIAYAGADDNIWLMQPDGSQQVQVTTDGGLTGSSTYDAPAWSHDGTMLAFSQRGNDGVSGGIWLLRDGFLSLVPNTGTPCQAPAFSADDQRLLYSCPQSISVGDPVPADLTTNPLQGYVTSSLLDGSDQRIEVPYSTDDSGVRWTSESKSGVSVRKVDVRPSDGMMMVVYSGFHAAGVQVFAADGSLVRSFDLLGDQRWLGPYDAHFTPDGQAIIASVCTSGCYPSYEDPTAHDILLLDLDGNVVDRWTQSTPGQTFAGVDMSPDGSRVAASEGRSGATDAVLVVFQAPMQPVTIGTGSSPAWQPNPGVKGQRRAATGAGSAERPVSPEAPASTSTNPITGAWSGTGYQSPQAIEWPIVIRIDDGAEGDVVGRVEYPSYGCVGDLTLLAVNDDGTIALRERIVEGLGTCVDGGEFTVSLSGNGGIAFRWVAPDGSSAAEGTLSPVSGGAATTSGDTSGIGPPSLYDDPETEPVPIEAEGG